MWRNIGNSKCKFILILHNEKIIYEKNRIHLSMRELLDRKKAVLDKNLPRITKRKIKANERISKILAKALKDRKIDANVSMGILKKIQAGGQISSDSSSKMNGEQKLEMVRMWLENAKNTIDEIRIEEKFAESYFKSIDEEIERCRQELKQIDEKLSKAKDKEERDRLMQDKKKGELL